MPQLRGSGCSVKRSSQAVPTSLPGGAQEAAGAEEVDQGGAAGGAAPGVVADRKGIQKAVPLGVGFDGKGGHDVAAGLSRSPFLRQHVRQIQGGGHQRLVPQVSEL